MHFAGFKGQMLSLDYLERVSRPFGGIVSATQRVTKTRLTRLQAGAFNDTLDKFGKSPFDYAVEVIEINTDASRASLLSLFVMAVAP